MQCSNQRALFLLACFLLGSPACAHPVGREQPLARWTPELRQRKQAQVEGDRSPELLVLLAFSGGAGLPDLPRAQPQRGRPLGFVGHYDVTIEKPLL